MQKIKKIDIKYFRSFGNSKSEIIDLSDLNIISGGNDSGKSNILRALNLFFNNEISPGIPLDIDRDFSFYREEKIANAKRKNYYIEITIYFEASSKTKFRSKEFSIKKRWNNKSKLSTIVYYDNTESFVIYNDNNKGNPDSKSRRKKGSINNFLNNIFFLYVPAVRDKNFYSTLYGTVLYKLQNISSNLPNGKLDIKMQELLEIINDETKILLNKIEIVKTKFSAPKNLLEFFTTFEITTEYLGRNIGINLQDRGDGIQAKFIPILLLLNEKFTQRKNASFIWGFEEPENSYEYKNADKLANELIEYSKSKQIFLTTHSFNFLLMENSNDHKISISKYRIEKDKNENSIATKINTEKLLDEMQLFHKDLGSSAESRIFQQKLIEAKSELIELNQTRKELNEIKKSTIYFEGETDVKYFKRYLEIKKLQLDINLKYAGGKSQLDKIWNISKVENVDFGHKVILVYDCDANKIEEVKGKISRFSLNKLNNPITKGIENLFPKETIEKLVKQKLIKKIEIRDLTNNKISQEFEIENSNKSKVCDYLIRNGTYTDFINFNKFCNKFIELLKE